MSNDFDDTTSSDSPPPMSRRSVLEYFNPAGYRVRRIFGTREKLIEGIKTLAWVVPLTILIWIYAERQQLVQNPVVVPAVGVRIQNNDPGRIVQINGPEDPTFTLKLMGPQEGVRKVIDQLTQHIPRERLVLVVGANRTNGTNQQINVADAIQNQDLFKSNGVSVQEVQPPELSVNIDKLGRRLVTVEIPPGQTNMTASGIEPPKVTVLGPESVLQKLGQNLHAYLGLDGYSQLKAGETYPLKLVPVVLSDPARLQVDPNHVDATVQVSQLDEPYEIDQVFVTIDALPSVLAKYNITPETQTINTVQVKGPKEQIEKLRNNLFTPKARLEISPDDAALKTSKVPTFELPPGVELVNPEAIKPINFTAALR